jgi:hypothetical protein
LLSVFAVQPKEHWDSRHMQVQDLAPVVGDDEKAVQNIKREHWDGEEVHRSNCLAMFLRNVSHRFTGSASLGARRIHRETLLSEISNPAWAIRRECAALPGSSTSTGLRTTL